MTEPQVVKLPRPPEQEEDRVNDLGWLSRGPSRRSDAAAGEAIEPLLLDEDDDSGLPPDPAEAPSLPPPPRQPDDPDTRGARPFERQVEEPERT